MYKIYIDGCPQFNNVFAAGNTNEGQQNIKVGDAVQKYLEATRQFQVFRPVTNANWTLDQIIADANSKTGQGDLYLAIHSNSGGGHGCEAYAYAVNTNSDKIAHKLYDKICAISPYAGRGVKYNPLAEVTDTTATAALVEVAFHDNVQEAQWLIDNADKIGKALAEGVCEYLGVVITPPVPTPDYKALYEASREQIKVLDAQLKSSYSQIQIATMKLNKYQKIREEMNKI